MKLSSKGQLVLPRSIRDALGLGAGTVLKVSASGQQIILEPVTTSMIECLHGKFVGAFLLDDLEAEHQQGSRGDLYP